MKKLTIIFIILLSLSFLEIADAQIPELYRSQGERIPNMAVPIHWRYKERDTEKYKHNLKTQITESKRGYIIYERNYLDLMSLKFPTKELESLRVSMAQDEYEPLVFGIYAIENLTDVKISINDLVNKEGSILSAENIDIRTVSWMPKKTEEKKSFALEPILLERFESLHIKQDEYKIIWLTILVPKDTPAGNYKGKIYIEPYNDIGKSFDLEIEVFPFELQKPPINFGIYYNIDTRWQGFYPENLRKHLVDIREHGLDHLTIYFAPKLNFKNSEIEVDFSRGAYSSPFSLDHFMSEYIKTGFKKPTPFLSSWRPLMGEIEIAGNFSLYSKEFDEQYKKAISLIEKYRSSKGWPEFLYTPEDEPANSKAKMRRAEHYLPLIKKAAPKARTYLTLNGLRKGIDEGKIFDPWLDVRCYAFFNQFLENEARNSENELWIYNGGSEGRYSAFLDRYFYGFYVMKAGAEGITQWVYQWPASLKSTPYNELFEQNEQGWYYTYPSSDGPIPTQRWKALREGIDDARYIFTLKQFISRAKSSGDKNIIKEALASEEKLNNIMDQIDVYHHIPDQFESARRIFGYYLPEENSKMMEEWREEIKEEMIKIHNLLSDDKK
jgi:hypothetical protein